MLRHATGALRRVAVRRQASTLILADHDGSNMTPSTLAALTAASKLNETSAVLVAGAPAAVAEDCADSTSFFYKPTPGPVAACEDSTSWYAKKSKRACEYVSEDPAKRCKKKDSESKVKGKEACPLACGTCAAFSLPEVVPNACGDSASWFVRENPSRDCAYVAKKASGRCDKKDDFGVPASEACAAACGSCLGGSGMWWCCRTRAGSCRDQCRWYWYNWWRWTFT